MAGLRQTILASTPSAQTPASQDGTASAPAVATAVPSGGGSTAVLSSATVTRSMSSANRIYLKQSEGRLNIPPVLVRQIGASTGNPIQVDRIMDMSDTTGNNKRLLISPTNTGRRDYMVNTDGRIRLSRTLVSYLNGNGTYQISIENGNLVVAPA